MRRSFVFSICCSLLASSCVLGDGFTGSGGFSRGGSSGIITRPSSVPNMAPSFPQGGYSGGFGSSYYGGYNPMTRPVPPSYGYGNGYGYGYGAGGAGYPNSQFGGMKPSRPTTRPNPLPNDPDGSTSRPGNRPSIPNLGSGGTSRPDMPGFGNGNAWTNQPATMPSWTRPSQGNVGASTVNRPPTGQVIVRPNNRPVDPDYSRPVVNQRPINLNQIVINNYYFNNQLSWVSLNVGQYAYIDNLWQNQLYGLNNWTTLYPTRVTYWNNWGNNVLHRWRWYPYHNQWFAGDWWYVHRTGLSQYHYCYQFNQHPWGYWWTYPTWNYVGTWFTWSAPATNWNTPIFYDYGNGGNVLFRNNIVFINGQQIASTNEFAQSAAILATLDPTLQRLEQRH